MLDAKATGSPWFPIFVHACVHGTLMALVLYFFTEAVVLLQLVLFQISTHFMIDALKGKMNIWFPKINDPTQQLYWVVFGLDQLMHHLVILAMVHEVSPV